MRRHPLILLAFLAACAPARPAINQVTIRGVDYAFIHPDTLPAGPTEITFINAGKHSHEMNLGRMKPGVTVARAVELFLKGQDSDSLYESWGAILIDAPGDTVPGHILSDLKPGAEYVLWCNFHDSTGTPAHAKLGMTGAIVVRS